MRALVIVLVLCAAAVLLWLSGATRPTATLRAASMPAEGASEMPVELAPAPACEPEAVQPERVALATRPSEPDVAWADERARSNGLSGIVLRPDRTPMHRAGVLFVWDDRGRSRMARATTGDDGRFELAVEDGEVVGDLLATVQLHTYEPASRTGVRAGTRGIELVLGAPDPLTLDLRDPDGRSVESVQAIFHWQLAGHRVRDDTWRPGVYGPLRWARSPVPFSIELLAHGYAPVELGPLAPEEVGATLVARLQPLPRLRGVVTWRGAPCAGAEVWVRAASEPPHAETWNGWARTDEEGRFEIFRSLPGPCELRAFAVPGGEGLLGPIDLDGSRDVDGLEIALTRPPGSIEGRVVLPAGHEPDELSLLVYGKGYRSLNEDGTFVLPGLPPGRCCVRVVRHTMSTWFEPGDTVRRSVSHGPIRAPDWLATEPSYTVEVRSGVRETLVIDLVGPAPCRLEGAIRIDGAPPRLRDEHPGAFLSPEPQVVLDLGDRDSRQSAADLDEEGRFLLGALGPGTCQLHVQLALQGSRHEKWLVSDEVELEAGLASWRLDVPTGALRLLPSSEARPLWGAGALVRWAGPDGMEVLVRWSELEEPRGSRLFRCVPAGAVEVVSGAGDERRVVLEGEVRAGELSEVRMPE